MIAGALSRLDRFARLFTPLFTGIFLVLIAAIPFRIPEYGRIAADLGLIVVFYWAAYRPDLLPAIAAFGLGLWQDLVTGGPLGLHALIYFLAHWAVASQLRFFQGKSFAVIWWAFGLVSAAAMLLSWLVVMMLEGAVIDGVPVLFRWAVTIALCPFVTWILARLQHAFLRQI